MALSDERRKRLAHLTFHGSDGNISFAAAQVWMHYRQAAWAWRFRLCLIGIKIN
jgi:hypothetical protein